MTLSSLSFNPGLIWFQIKYIIMQIYGKFTCQSFDSGVSSWCEISVKTLTLALSDPSAWRPQHEVENLLSSLATRWLVYKPNQRQQIPASWTDVLSCLNFPAALWVVIPVSIVACGDNYKTRFWRGPLHQKCWNSNRCIMGLPYILLIYISFMQMTELDIIPM